MVEQERKEQDSEKRYMEGKKTGFERKQLESQFTKRTAIFTNIRSKALPLRLK